MEETNLPHQTPVIPKTFILDTNILLHNPDSIFSFEDNDVVIPSAVIEEIDDQKKRQDEIGRNARVVSHELDELRKIGHLSDGVRLPSGGRLRIELNHQKMPDILLGWDPLKKDNRILSLAHHLRQESEGAVRLVTKDLGLRIKADVLHIPAEDFYNDKIDHTRLYGGAGELIVTENELNTFYKQKALILNGDRRGFPNQFFVLKNSGNPSQSALCRYLKKTLYHLAYGENIYFGIRAKNKEQKFALELLMNDDVKVVTLVGRAGTGKTLIALAIGLEKILEQKVYTKLLITRPIVPMGNDLGYLPGTKEEKLRPWMQPIFDNLEFLFGNNQESKEPQRIIEHLMDSGIIEMEALTYIRGRSIPKQFIICDEAQNLTPHMIKTLLTRVGEGTKIVFTGDLEQIDHPYLDASSNGLTYVIEKMKTEEITGHVMLLKGERSAVAELGARLL
ncbi:MAG: PhoH family protein [Syntrophales bacterium]